MTNTQGVKVETNHKPIYCRGCHSQNTFEGYPEGDIKTESGKPFMLKFKCRVCGHTCLMSNKEYRDEKKESTPFFNAEQDSL